MTTLHVRSIQLEHDHLCVLFGADGRHRCISMDVYPDEHPGLAAAWSEMQTQCVIASSTIMLDLVPSMDVPDAVPAATVHPCRICGTSVAEDDPGATQVGPSGLWWYCARHGR